MQRSVAMGLAAESGGTAALALVAPVLRVLPFPALLHTSTVIFATPCADSGPESAAGCCRVHNTTELIHNPTGQMPPSHPLRTPAQPSEIGYITVWLFRYLFEVVRAAPALEWAGRT